MSCVRCGASLTGLQTKFCCGACKQAVKNSVSKGVMCGACYKPMKPRKILGGFEKTCSRARCPSNLTKEK